MAEHPILSALEEFERPPQLITVDHEIPLDVGEQGIAKVKFVVHQKNEGRTIIRVVDISPMGESMHNSAHPPMIVPSPSA